MPNIVTGKAFVVGDNIDTDQIIPARHLSLVPTIPEEYEALGSHALCGLPDTYPRFVAEGEIHSEYSVIIGGRNFGCGSSREHAPVSLGAAGARVVVAESFARIFFRNCVSTGELYPVESPARLCNIVETGDLVEVDLDSARLTLTQSGETFELLPLGEAKNVIDGGGLFKYARASGMIG